MWSYYYSTELYHHGIKGMKWGIRRYQNADGSLTDAGKRRVRRASRVKSVYAHKAQKQIDFNTKLAKAADKHLKIGKDVNNHPLTAENKKAYQHEYDTYIKAAKEWSATKKDIMNMNVSEIKAKDVKRRFKDTNAGGAFIY